MSVLINNYTEEEIQKITENLLQGHTVADVLNVETKNLETLYALAYDYYNIQDYHNAEILFQVLCTYTHKEEKYWMGLAGCRQALNNFQQAIDAYSMAGLATQFKNPLPFFYASQCFLKMNNKVDAITSLKSLLVMGDDNIQEYKLCKEKAQEILKLLEEK